MNAEPRFGGSAPMGTPEKPLRILVVVNLKWDPRLGAARVWMELAEQWRAAGHTVDKFCLSDAYPEEPVSRPRFALRHVLFARKAAAYVRENRGKYDVIDALIGTLPYSKRQLGFDGLLVARSVGLYILYERFEQRMAQQTPAAARGKLIGRFFYPLVRRRVLRLSDRAVRHADLINVPNEAEAACLRKEAGAGERVLLQPYGLTPEHARAFAQTALPAEARLAQKRICFIGMWSPRKGAFDWARIIRGVRAQIPEAQFRFLGTMLEAALVRKDLGAEAAARIELVSDFQPDELPALLSDCTVGAFPSYVEGFGLAVIEQLATGLPVIAYDTAGPRDILQRNFPDALIPSGAAEDFAAALCRVLRLEPDRYREQSRLCRETAAAYSWPQIARETAQAYRQARRTQRGPVVFVQPFGLGSPGGGSRILRALLENAPHAWQSICTSPEKPRPWRHEMHRPFRPFFGRIEYTRFAGLPHGSAPLFAGAFRRRLKRACRRLRASAIHVIPHSGLDFAEAQTVARELSIPFLVSLHDDLAYTAIGRAPPARLEAAMDRAWKGADARFVISEVLGREYCRRYGEASFEIVTDGVAQLSAARVRDDPHRLRIYFMGLFHRGYERNLRALLEAIVLFERSHPDVVVSMTLRCEHVHPATLAGVKKVTILPFADEAQVQRDLEEADLLYMPLPFSDAGAGFARYSLSTKMVTYLGSGLPILYHGPENAAACELLQKHRAAFPITTLLPAEIATVLDGLATAARHEVVENALALARRDFVLADQKQRFWRTISQCLKQ